MVRLCFGRQKQLDDQIHEDLPIGSIRRVSYRSLQLATNNFSHDRLIGEGGYARIYRGALPNGTVIAVKNYKARESSGRNVSLEEFTRTVELASRIRVIRHPNIHQVLGCCMDKSHLLIVSEYVDNGSLHDLLHNQLQKRFSWPMRAAVCIGIARGLTHLHEEVHPRAVHGDIKPSNILLDANFTPKITDFDLVKFFPDDNDILLLEAEAVDRTSGYFDFDSDSMFTFRIVGTIAYLDPEYVRVGRVTQKSDVYSFGVTMLETISGRQALNSSHNSHDHYLAEWALNLLRDGRVLEIVDPVLTDFPTDEVRHFLDVAFSCIKREWEQRPSMREVTQMLEGTSNVFGRQLLAPNSPHYYSAASSFRSSISQTDDEGGGETEPAVSEFSCVIARGEGFSRKFLLPANMVRLCFGRQKQLDEQIHDDLPIGSLRRVSYRSLQLATNNFHKAMLIGKGGFARVYRGVLPNGTVIAVKNYRAREFSCTAILEEFSRTVELASRIPVIRHPNIHQVIGYCMDKSHLLIVSEYVGNGSLHDLLHNQQHKRFSWPTRAAVCIGITRGLTLLHEDVNPRVVHSDIKPANVLLDRDFTPKITDFDLVKFFPTSTVSYGDDDDALTLEAEAVDRKSGHFDSDPRVTTLIRGTKGYIDPEYLDSGRLTQKSDVHGFGVTMLEIISRRKVLDLSYDDDNRFIVDWALNLLRDDRVLEIVDPLLTDFPTDDVRRFLDVAFSCIQLESKQRPSMREVTQMLEGTLNVFGRQLLAPYSPHYYSAASSFRTSISQTDDEGGGETQPAVSEIEQAGTSAAQSHGTTVSQQLLAHQQQQLGVVLSGTGDLVERLSQTMVFTRSTQRDFPEAVFPPFRTRVFSRGGSRHLYTF